MSIVRNSEPNHQNDNIKTSTWTIFIATIALLLSIYNMYFTHFWKDYNIKVAIMNLGFIPDSSFTIDVVFMNDGNQSAIILDAFLMLPSEYVKDIVSSGPNIIDGDTLPRNSYSIIGWNSPNEDKLTPTIVLNPSQMVTKTIKFDYSWRHLTFINKSVPTQVEFSIDAQIHFRAIDLKGEKHERSKKITLNIVNGKVSWIRLGSPTIITLIR